MNDHLVHMTLQSFNQVVELKEVAKVIDAGTSLNHAVGVRFEKREQLLECSDENKIVDLEEVRNPIFMIRLCSIPL